MGRDPLEGVRPSDSDPPAFSYTPPPAPGPIVASDAAQPVSPGRPSRGKVLLLTYTGVLLAILVGAFAYFLTIPHTRIGSKATSSVSAEPSPTAAPADDVEVKQGPMPREDPAPAPAPTTAAK